MASLPKSEVTRFNSSATICSAVSQSTSINASAPRLSLFDPTPFSNQLLRTAGLRIRFLAFIVSRIPSAILDGSLSCSKGCSFFIFPFSVSIRNTPQCSLLKGNCLMSVMMNSSLMTLHELLHLSLHQG